MMEEEDEVTEEIPIFLSAALSKNLYVYQYPMRPLNQELKQEEVMTSLIKPKNHKVKLELAINTQSYHYNNSKGEEIALNVDDENMARFLNKKPRERPPYYQSGVMDKISYESNAPVGDCSNFAVAMLQDNELHLTSVKSILQLRPSFSYVDKQNKKKKEETKAGNVESDNDEEAEAQQITVKFAKIDNDMSKRDKEESYEAMMLKVKEEPWYESVWWQSTSDAADLERLKLFCPSRQNGSTLALPNKKYLQNLVPAPPLEEDEGVGDNISKTRDLRSINTLPLAEQCREILCSAKVLSLATLKNLVKSPDDDIKLSENDLVVALNTSACFIRGLWTAKSSDIYVKPSKIHGVPGQRMSASRDYVIFLFTKSDYIDRRKVTAALKLPPAEILDILQSIAKPNSLSGWELLLPPDKSVEEKYPEIAQRQLLFWEAKQRQFSELLSGEPKRQRKKSMKDSFSESTSKPRCNSTGSSHEEDSDGKKKVKSKLAGETGKRSRKLSDMVNEVAAQSC